MSSLEQRLGHTGGDLQEALQHVRAPMYMLDKESRVTWINDAAREFVPTAIGRKASELLTADQVNEAKRQFALKILGAAEVTDYRTAIRAQDGTRVEVDISSVPLRDGNTVVGVFGVFRSQSATTPAKATGRAPELTPRQHEVLALLNDGLSTSGMADKLHISEETVRSHIKAVLRQLGARSRLEAVLHAHRLGLLAAPIE